MKRIAWTEQARADVRAMDRAAAMRILRALHRFAETGTGDVKALQGDMEELRLRVGDYRLFFVCSSDGAIEVRRIRHRREAYR
ncbi:MAG: type II toxin-antitoxin system RelE family toxin [Bryobacteraceae bacterium]